MAMVAGTTTSRMRAVPWVALGTPVLLAAVLFASLWVAGCHSRRRTMYGSVPTVDARQVERLRRVGERDMRCPAGSLVMVPMTQNAVELRGCDRIREYSLVCRGTRRCNWQPMMPAALLATNDLGCPLEAMSVAAPSASTRDLIGCGRMGRYAISCVDDAVCRWNLLGPVGPDTGAVPPPTYGGGYAVPPASPSAGGGVPPPPGATVAPPPTGSVTVSGQVSVGEVPPPPR